MSLPMTWQSLLGAAGLDVVYRKLGNYMTSIDMAGLSLTLMKIEDEAWLTALESPVKDHRMVRMTKTRNRVYYG